MSGHEFNGLLLNNADYLRPFALTLTRDNESARDLLQETLLRALKYFSNTSGIQYQLGPISKVNPAASNFLARPPAISCFSKSVTSQPSRAINVAAEIPAKPPPITISFFTRLK